MMIACLATVGSAMTIAKLLFHALETDGQNDDYITLEITLHVCAQPRMQLCRQLLKQASYLSIARKLAVVTHRFLADFPPRLVLGIAYETVGYSVCYMLIVHVNGSGL